jgi:hypothetical protein
VRRIRILILALLVMVAGGVLPVRGQGNPGYQWPAPLNPGQMPTNNPLLPPASAMPTPPLTEPLIPGTLFFNIQDFTDGYRILNLTLDSRLYAYNISNRDGVYPVSNNGQYGIVKEAENETTSTCAIIDLLTEATVDRFETDSACAATFWSPDSKRIFFTTVDEQGNSALAIRQDGQNTVFRPRPAGEINMGGISPEASFIYIAQGWVSDTVITFDMGLQGALSQQVFSRIGALDAAYPAKDLTLEQTGQRFVSWRTAQPLESFFRGLWLTDVADEGNSFPLAPSGTIAWYASHAPDDSAIVYWGATEGTFGPVHPLRLVIYVPATDEQIVLLQFDGPPSENLVTRPGILIWNPEGIYFHISQLEGSPSPLQTGTYRIQPDGSNLEYVSPELLWSSLLP